MCERECAYAWGGFILQSLKKNSCKNKTKKKNQDYNNDKAEPCLRDV